jgi:hypothetical protein
MRRRRSTVNGQTFDCGCVVYVSGDQTVSGHAPVLQDRGNMRPPLAGHRLKLTLGVPRVRALHAEPEQDAWFSGHWRTTANAVRGSCA